MTTNTVGVIVNPSAGRDSRRLVGSAVISDNFAKRRAGVSVLEGFTGVEESVNALLMPDEKGIAQQILADAPDEVPARTLDIPVEGTRKDTQRAANQLQDAADAVIVLGGDGTIRDVAMAVDDLPIGGVSTGTNNVVPASIDATAAGLAAAILATGAVDIADVTFRHGTVRGVLEKSKTERDIMGLATVGIIDREFTGTRAILRGDDFIGGVVSRADAVDSGLSGIMGTLETTQSTDPGGVGARFGPPDATGRDIHAIPVPGIVDRIGVETVRTLADDESMVFEVESGVVSFDGERDLEVQNAHIRLWPSTDGPCLIDFQRLFGKATAMGYFDS